jgi:hypothetical protein
LPQLAQAAAHNAATDAAGNTATPVSLTVDANSVGSDSLTYNATDASGNTAAPVTPTVNVTAAAAASFSGGGGLAFGWVILLVGTLMWRFGVRHRNQEMTGNNEEGRGYVTVR